MKSREDLESNEQGLIDKSLLIEKKKIQTCEKCGCILPIGWTNTLCSVECFVGDNPND